MADTATLIDRTMETERSEGETDSDDRDFDDLLRIAVEALPIPEEDGGEDLDDIPEAVPVRKPPVLASLPSAVPKSVRRVGVLPVKREPSATEPLPERAAGRRPIDTSRFVRFDDHRNGQYRVEPLERIPGERRERGTASAPKFMDGELPRSVERGIRHPNPGLLRLTALLLLVTRLFMAATIIALPVVAIAAPELMPSIAWIPATFFLVGLVFLLCARRCRCRVCSCHLFFVKRCFKNRNAHKLRFFGYAGSAALHLLFFRWMRCMYCGTAIRLRIPKGEEHLYP